MKVQFVGVGEAFDELLPNNSQILEWNHFRLLIDCGYAVPHALWKLDPDPHSIDAVYISHRHADHYFGLPSYLLRLAEDHRQKDILILCGKGLRETIEEMIEYAYKDIVPKLGFSIRYQEVEEAKSYLLESAVLEFALSSHPVRNHAISVAYQGKKYCYSGDGNFNARTRALYRSATMLVHEAYALDQRVHGHALIPELLQMAVEEGVNTLCLTHLQRDVRRNKRNEIDRLIAEGGLRVLLPEPGEIHHL